MKEPTFSLNDKTLTPAMTAPSAYIESAPTMAPIAVDAPATVMLSDHAAPNLTPALTAINLANGAAPKIEAAPQVNRVIDSTTNLNFPEAEW
jgi:hypothetical protein